MTTIACKYFVQNEDNDLANSNLFLLSGKCKPGEKLKLKDILAEFPLVNSNTTNYHLRFQTFLPESPTSPIWIDILNEEAFVPLIEPNLIYIKALRLPVGIKQKLKHANPSPTSNPVTSTKQVKNDNDEEFDLGSSNNTPMKEEQRPRIDSDTKKAAFDIDIGNTNIDLTPTLEPTTYKETTKPKETIKPTKPVVNKPRKEDRKVPEQKVESKEKPDIVKKRVDEAVIL